MWPWKDKYYGLHIILPYQYMFMNCKNNSDNAAESASKFWELSD